MFVCNAYEHLTCILCMLDVLLIYKPALKECN